MPLSLCRLSFILNSSHDIEQKPFLAWPPLAWTPFKKGTPKCALNTCLILQWHCVIWQIWSKIPWFWHVYTHVAILFFLIFSYFFSFGNVGVILFFLIFSYFFLFFLIFLIFSYFVWSVHLIFSYFFLLFLIFSYFFLFLSDQSILFFLIFSYLFLFFLIFSYFFLFLLKKCKIRKNKKK